MLHIAPGVYIFFYPSNPWFPGAFDGGGGGGGDFRACLFFFLRPRDLGGRLMMFLFVVWLASRAQGGWRESGFTCISLPFCLALSDHDVYVSFPFLSLSLSFLFLFFPRHLLPFDKRGLGLGGSHCL